MREKRKEKRKRNPFTKFTIRKAAEKLPFIDAIISNPELKQKAIDSIIEKAFNAMDLSIIGAKDLTKGGYSSDKIEIDKGELWEEIYRQFGQTQSNDK